MIKTPKGELISPDSNFPNLSLPFVLKAQVPMSDRKKNGGIVFIEDKDQFGEIRDSLLEKSFGREKAEVLLAEEKIGSKREIYLSFSYSTDFRAPVLAISKEGGTGIEDAYLVGRQANIFPIDLSSDFTSDFIKDALEKTELPSNDKLVQTIFSLWELFTKEKALLAEINPLFETESGVYIAGDSKIILDDNVVNPQFKPYLDLDGDIAVIASGGGASLLNLDALIKNGGKPANYVEYSGNPSADSVKELTKKVLSKPGIKGCWVVGGTANFTDIYETMLGFIRALKEIEPKPTYPIVIRRDGPRQREAFEMLKKEGEEHGFDFHLYGPETPMSKSAEIVVDLSYKK